MEKANRILRKSFDTISHSVCRRMTEPIRFLLAVLKWLLHPRAMKELLRKGLYSLISNGLRVTWRKAMQKIYFRESYSQIAKQALFSEKELAEQRRRRFPRKIKFSIVVPLYNTPERFLREMIESVLDQTYADWELCMADGSGADHREVESICREYAEQDRRIRYRKLGKNLGISGNTNACLEMAKGDYIGLFDHDDLLHPAALHEAMRAICEKNADFIYTDEAVFASPDRNNIISVHFKPDYAPDNLRANNYICHFTVFRHALLDEVGLFNPACDGSQDHDMVLRLTEKAEHIAHIPEILYYWRSHADSVAQDISVKSYAAEAGRKAVAASVSRMGYSTKVSSSPVFPAIYNVQYDLVSKPLISVILPVRNPARAQACVSSMLEQSAYRNFEIILVIDESADKDILDSYSNNPAVRICRSPGPCSRPLCFNLGSRQAAGEYLVLLDEGIKILTQDWMEQLLTYAQRRDVAAVGAMLYDDSDRIQESGLILGFGWEGIADCPFAGAAKGEIGYMGRLAYAQNCSAVSAACMMVCAELFREVGGMDERFDEQYYDLDLCMKFREKGYLNVWTPYAEMRCHAAEKKRSRHAVRLFRKRRARKLFCCRWKNELKAGDPYYNPNFSLTVPCFSFAPKIEQHKARDIHETRSRYETIHIA